MTLYEQLVDAVGAVDRLLAARGPRLSAGAWAAVVDRLERATAAARALEDAARTGQGELPRR